MRFFFLLGFLVLGIATFLPGDSYAQEVSQLLEGLEITDVDTRTCTVNGEERHELSADFSLQLNFNERQMVRDGLIWDVYADINVAGAMNGSLVGFVTGTLDDWTLGLEGTGQANISVSIPVTGYKYRGFGRRRRLVATRSFGYLGATINVQLADSATLESQCSDGDHGEPTITTRPPVVTTTISIISANYTGPFSIFGRLRARIESTMRSQFTQQINQQVARGTLQYQAKRDALVGELIAKLPSGCICMAQSLSFIGTESLGSLVTSQDLNNESHSDSYDNRYPSNF